MTMGVGFLCRTGIVIASDRQVTSTDSHTFPARKTRQISWSNGKGIYTFSGSPFTAGEFRREIESRLTRQTSASEEEVRGYFKDSLAACLKEKEGFSILLGTWVEGGWPVLRISSDFDVAEGERCEIIGWGDTALSRYLRGLVQFSVGLTINQAISWAIYFVQQGTKYSGQYVGGGTDVLLLDENRTVRVMDIAWTGPWEQQLLFLEVKLMQLLSILSHPETTPDRAKHDLELFNSYLSDFCAKVRDGKWR